VYIEVKPLKQTYEPYLDDGVVMNRGIIDFRITLSATNGREDFKRVSYLITEAVANTVDMFAKTLNHRREMA